MIGSNFLAVFSLFDDNSLFESAFFLDFYQNYLASWPLISNFSVRRNFNHNPLWMWGCAFCISIKCGKLSNMALHNGSTYLLKSGINFIKIYRSSTENNYSDRFIRIYKDWTDESTHHHLFKVLIEYLIEERQICKLSWFFEFSYDKKSHSWWCWLLILKFWLMCSLLMIIIR